MLALTTIVISISDYECIKPLSQFIGSVDDKELLRRACEGVSCVMHIAGVVDVSMFPNNKRLTRINVQGKML